MLKCTASFFFTIAFNSQRCGFCGRENLVKWMEPQKDSCFFFSIIISTPECDIRMDFDTNEYPNIFVLRKWYERISEYIRMKFFDTNEYPNIFVSKFWHKRISEYICIKILIQMNFWINIRIIWIFEYICHTLY